MEGVLIGMGNPLLDATITVDAKYLEKYELQPANAILAEPKHDPIYADILARSDAKYGAGGAALNTIRAAQWMLQVPNASSYAGCVGNDKSAEILKNVLNEGGVAQHFVNTNDAPTGTCAVLIVDKDRSMVTKLGAAEKFSDAAFATEEIQAAMKKARLYFSTGFFLTVVPKSLVEMGKMSLENGKRFLFNLAAPFCIKFFWEPLVEVLKYADVVFCNDAEALVAGETNKWGSDLDVIAEKLAHLPLAEGKKSRTAVITAGPDNTVVYFNEKVYHFSPIKLTDDQIVDTNGAGDSFTGGFISQYLYHGMDKDLTEETLKRCIDAAHYAASKAISVVGCKFEGKPDFK